MYDKSKDNTHSHNGTITNKGEEKMESTNQNEKKLTSKVIFALALLKKEYAREQKAQIPKVLFANNEQECKENGINTPQAMTSTIATLPSRNLAKKEKTTYNEKIATAYIPL